MRDIAARPVLRSASWTQRSIGLSFGILWLLALLVIGAPIVLWSAGQLSHLLLIFASTLALYLLPGWSLLNLLWRDPPLTLTERGALACGLSVALPPLLLEIAQLIGLPWTTATTVVYLGIALLASILPLLWRVRRAGRLRLSEIGTGLASSATTPLVGWHAVALGMCVLWGLLLRLFVVRDLPVGMWGDSYQHTMMAQLLVDNRGLFQSWQPYAPLQTFTYHYGFHANVALFHWITGIPVVKSVLYVGQILNAATIPLAYLLTARLSGNKLAGVWAAALTGFINIQPAFYVNWGRYTQLAGHILLPVVLVCWVAALEQPRLAWRALVLAALATACLMLTHYIVTFFAALFVSAYLVLMLLRATSARTWWRLLAGSGAIATMALVLTIPWLWNTFSGYLARNIAGFVNQEVRTERIVSYATLDPLVPNYVNRPILLLALLGMLLAVARRRWHVRLFGLWTLLLLFTVTPHLVGLPGSGVVNQFTAEIALYITVVPLAAYLLGEAHDVLARWRPHVAFLAGSASLLLVLAWGSSWQQHLIDPKYQLFTPADTAAMEWIQANTPPDALFLVNMFPAFGDTLMAGDDGGWWIPLLTGRRSTLPPLTYGSELGPTADYARSINDLAFSLHRTPLPSAEGVQVLEEAGIRYIYLGPHVEQPAYRINGAALRKHPAFNLVYERDGVEIFAFEARS